MDRENIMAELQQKLIDDKGSSANSNPGFLINETTDQDKDIVYNTGNIGNILPRAPSQPN
jgi:hypothetical protein